MRRKLIKAGSLILSTITAMVVLGAAPMLNGVPAEYVCGDANGDGIANITDAVYLVEFIFNSGPAPDPIEAGDANADGSTNISDAVYLVSYVFVGGAEPQCPSDSGLTYRIVDTGQDQYYNASVEIAPPSVGQPFYGQDAQYDGAQPAYQDNGDGTVSDLNTGLMWQQTFSGKLTFDDAVAAADTFSLAGYTDWRIPSIKELYSLMDFRGTDPSGLTGADTSLLTPFIDQAYFEFIYGDENAGERLIDAQYWSSTEYLGVTINGAQSAFGVNVADGRIKGYPTEPIGPPGNQFLMTSFVRYVRGNIAYGVNDFVDNSDGTVSDAATGLMWMQADSDSGLTWEQALAYAENLAQASQDDWRLPNAKEMQSILDYTRCPQITGTPAIDPLFNCTAITDEGGGTDYPFYWTGTTHANTSAEPGAWGAYICFGSAYGFMEEPPGSGTYDLQDVHGAGAQRSDPKFGNPDDYPNGHGPQGDVVRIYNYVRCVRDAN